MQRLDAEAGIERGGQAPVEVELDVETAQFEQCLEAGGGSVGVLLRNLGDHLGRQVTGVEEVIDLGQPEPQGQHPLLAVCVVALAKFREAGVGGLPELDWESEGIKTLRW